MAPLDAKSLVKVISSSKVMGGCGEGNSAEPPPACMKTELGLAE